MNAHQNMQNNDQTIEGLALGDESALSTIVEQENKGQIMDAMRGSKLALLGAFTAASVNGTLTKGYEEQENARTHTEKMADHQDHHLSPERKALIQKHWHDQDAVYEKISKMGMQKYYDALPDKERAFFTAVEIAAGKGKCSCCSDEGKTEYDNAEGRPMLLIRTPGSGILHALDRDDKNPFDPEFVDQSARELLEADVTVHTGHAGCGAAKAALKAWLFAQGNTGEAEHLTQNQVDAFAQKWAVAVTKKMQELAPEKAGAIRADFIVKLDRPKEIHRARILYLTDDDTFNAKYRGLPQGFVERTGGKKDLGKVLDHADILRQIAFDPSHGFGTKFEEEPSRQFVICCIAKDDPRLAELMEKTKDSAKKLPPDVQKKVRVEGFVR